MDDGRYSSIGWTLFAVSGVFFLIVAVRDADGLVLTSAVAWLLGVAAFLLGHRRSRRGSSVGC